MNRSPARISLVCSLAALGFVSTDAWAQTPIAPACNSTIAASGSYVLTSDIICAGAPASGYALQITANNVSLDFAGFRIELPSGTGVRVNGRTGTTLVGVKVETTTAATGTGLNLANTTNTAINGGDLDGGAVGGLATGIVATGTHTNLDISGVSVANATNGMQLDGVDAASSLTGNTFDGTRSGLRLRNIPTGPFTVGSTNTFVGAGTTTSAEVIGLYNAHNVTVDGLDLSGSGAGLNLGVGVRVDGSTGAIVTNNDLSHRYRGLQSSGTLDNTDLDITNNDVSFAAQYGMLLNRVNTTLVLSGNTFDNAAQYGLRIDALNGPWALEPTNSFVAVSNVSNGRALWLNATSDVTVDGLDLSGTDGAGLYLQSTSNTVFTNGDLSGRRYGVFTTAPYNPGLTITDSTVWDATVYAMYLQGVDASLVLSGNDLTGSAQGLYITDLAGPWALDPTNVFTDVAVSGTQAAVNLRQSQDLTVDGLDLAGNGTGGYGVVAFNVDGLTVTDSDLSARARGISATGTNNANFDIQSNDVSGATDWGMSLAGVTDLVVHHNVFDGDRQGLRLDTVDDTTPPTVLDLAGSSFEGIGTSNTHSAVRVVNSSDVTISQLDANMNGVGSAVWVDNSSNVLTTALLSCNGQRGVYLNGSFNSSVDYSQIGAGPAGTTYGVDVSNGGGHSFNNSETRVDTALRDVGSAPATTSVGLTGMGDSDGDGFPDLCDDCPADGAATSPPCNNTGCAGGDGVTDTDGDGWCQAIDPYTPGPGDDCDDGEPTMFPGNPEVCDGLDNNCRNGIDEGASFFDADGDTCNDCAVGPADPANDGTDTDGDGACDAGDPDDDGDTVADGPDVADLDASRCRDLDLDSCDDCSVAFLPQAGNDGADADTDGFCNTADFTLAPTVLVTKPSWNTFATAGAGSPTVVWDTAPATDHYVMVYETQTAASGGGCASGTWTLGLATSTDGLTWTDAGSALLPNSGYYSCVAAHPTMVKNGNGPIVLYFKAEDTTGYRGMGRLVMSWNGASYTVSTVDPNPALAVVSNFGYPKAVYDNAIGQYRIAYTQRPTMYTTRGTGAALNPGTVSLAPGFAAWAPDEVFNPAVTCEANGSYQLYVGGRDNGPGPALPVLNASMGRRQSARGNFTSWSIGPGALVSKSPGGDPEMRHWDVLRAGTSDHLLFFSERAGGTGPVQIRLGYTGASQPAPSTTKDKVCQ